jgi:hypothetical protein
VWTRVRVRVRTENKGKKMTAVTESLLPADLAHQDPLLLSVMQQLCPPISESCYISEDSMNVDTPVTVVSLNTENRNEIRVRLEIKQHVRALIEQNKFTEAILAARSISTEFHRAVTLACLRCLIDSFLTPASPTYHHIPVNDAALYDAVYNRRDAEALYLLQHGARILWQEQYWRRAALELFAANDMPLTNDYLVEKNMIPRDLGIEYFNASAGSRNSRLTYYLSTLPRIADRIASLSDEKKQLLHALYFYWKCRNLQAIYSDVCDLRQIDERLHVGDLTDEEFVKFVRCVRLFSNCSDQHVLRLRNQFLRNDASQSLHEGLIARIVALMDVYPQFDQSFVTAARRRLPSAIAANYFALPFIYEPLHQVTRAC